ncbi:MAG: OsmC family protein [Bdellovibrionales bacterium]|nr:OsmC family protein [Bdellovibrionales bacterium]
MGVKMSGRYLGRKRCETTHEQSGSKIETDAPKDNMGEGSRFSPTDLVGAALGTCIITTMAIVAERDGMSFEGATYEVTKEMVTEPTRRIGTLRVKITLPKSIPESYRSKLDHVARACPVHKSLHPDVQMPIEIVYV